jgi:hypothetical protein
VLKLQQKFLFGAVESGFIPLTFRLSFVPPRWAVGDIVRRRAANSGGRDESLQAGAA